MNFKTIFCCFRLNSLDSGNKLQYFIMVTIILLCLLTSSTLAAVVPQVLSQPEDASPRELNISHLSLPPEVLTEALFYYVDTLQDQLEQCEGAVSFPIYTNFEI